jgi:hypothetical protein
MQNGLNVFNLDTQKIIRKEDEGNVDVSNLTLITTYVLINSQISLHCFYVNKWFLIFLVTYIWKHGIILDYSLFSNLGCKALAYFVISAA